MELAKLGAKSFPQSQQNRCEVVKYHEEREPQEETQGATALRYKRDEIVDQVFLLNLNLVVGKQDFISYFKIFKIIEDICRTYCLPNFSRLTSNLSPTSVNFLYEHGGLHPVILVISVLVLSRRIMFRLKYLLFKKFVKFSNATYLHI